VEGVRRAGDAAAAGVAEDVGVDHCRLDVLVAEQLLDSADVAAGHQEVGREAVPEGVAADLLRNAGGAGGCVQGLADDRLVEVVAPLDAGARVGEGVRQVNTAETLFEVLVVEGPDLGQVIGEPIARRIRQHGHSIAAAFRVADADVAEVEVDVLNPESEALEDSHAGAVEQKDHKLGGSLEVRRWVETATRLSTARWVRKRLRSSPSRSRGWRRWNWM